MPQATPAIRRYAIILTIWAVLGLTYSAVSEMALVLVIFVLFPLGPIVALVWVFAGLLSTIGGLIEARQLGSARLILAFAVLPTLAFAAMIGLDRASWSHPSDAQMDREFREHRGEFEDLLIRYRADKQLGRIAPDFTRPANFFSGDSLPYSAPPTAARLAEIRRRSKHLHLVGGIEGYDDKRTVDFLRSARGISISGSSKGFTWSPDPPKLIVPDTDRYRSADHRSYTVYRAVEGDWYVFYATN